MCPEVTESGFRTWIELAAISARPHDGTDNDDTNVQLLIDPVCHIGQSESTAHSACHVIPVVGVLAPVTDDGKFDYTSTTGRLPSSLHRHRVKNNLGYCTQKQFMSEY